ncbi:MAG: heterodisulfide reductase subunit C [Dehalococcoidales bacterium]|jgi:heterodisulfide reductase subunit C|nr:heterodisulfide reductase subunit C [Dehalococcoidales bacterium]
MQYVAKNVSVIGDTGFSPKVKEASGTNIDRCYQCLTCSLDCPVAFTMDYLPHQVVRLVQLGLRRKVLTSDAIWICANCETCATRCPKDVAIPRVMDTLRAMALQEKVVEKGKDIVVFHHTFLSNIRRWGRQYELSLLLQIKFKTRDFFSDLGLGLRILWQGKLKLRPPRLKDVTGVRAIFRRIDQSLARGEWT